MKSIKTKIQISMLSAVLVSAVLIGVITALLNASGIDAVMEKTMLPATQMAADAVEWHMDKYWTALQEAAASDIFRESDPTAPELIPVRDDIARQHPMLRPYEELTPEQKRERDAAWELMGRISAELE